MSTMIVTPVVIVDTSSTNPQIVPEAPTVTVSFMVQVV
jgi:hypothetical protein